ncbi:CFDP2 protein, partial [Polypterus senegalus]
MGRYGVKERNEDGQRIVDFSKRMDMAVVKTYFKKREEHRVTYKTGGSCTQVDYILCRRVNLKEIVDCKVVAGESVVKQHRMVVYRMTLEIKKRKRVRAEWNLKKENFKVEFREKMRQARDGSEELPDR